MENAAAFSLPMMLPSSQIVLMSSRRTAKPLADMWWRNSARDLPQRTAADGERGLAGQQGRFDVAVDEPLRLVLRHADAERQAEIVGRPVLDTRIGRKGAGRRSRSVECRKRATAAGARTGIVFQRVETGIDGEGRVLQGVAELHAVGGYGAEIAERRGAVESAQGIVAARGAQKPAGRKIGTGDAACVIGIEIGIAETEEPVRIHIGYRHGLGTGVFHAETRGQQCQSES